MIGCAMQSMHTGNVFFILDNYDSDTYIAICNGEFLRPVEYDFNEVYWKYL